MPPPGLQEERDRLAAQVAQQEEKLRKASATQERLKKILEQRNQLAQDLEAAKQERAKLLEDCERFAVMLEVRRPACVAQGAALRFVRRFPADTHILCCAHTRSLL